MQASHRETRQALRHGDDQGPNPFPVYPVRALVDLSDILDVTVETEQVARVAASVRSFAEAFHKPGDQPPRLLLAARGDFGTGKTHLMQYARAALAAEMRRQYPSMPHNAPCTVLAVALEETIEDWYSAELGPELVARANPRELVRELLTEIACTLALEDEDTAPLAAAFRESRRSLYEAFRDPGIFDIGEVDRRFTAEIARLCPRASLSFRRMIEALRWEEKAEPIEEWLAGSDLSPQDLARARMAEIASRPVRPADAICAMAALCRRLGRPFALFIDEFEHLARFDVRTGSKRNITWFKRLVESLVRRGAMVFVSGHWEAWVQQGDFLDRFMGAPPIQLVRLTPEDIMKIVDVRAGPGRWPGFTATAAEAVVEETSGNIRRVVTVLYDLWRKPATREGLVTREAVAAAAKERLQPGSEAGLLPAVERAARAQDATLSRKETVEGSEMDIVVRRNGDPRLLVAVLHARDELALQAQCEAFAGTIRAARRSWPNATGLCIAVGAVATRQLATLDAAFPETTLLNGERADAIERIPGIVAAAVAARPAPQPEPANGAQTLDSLRSELLDRAQTQIQRSAEVFEGDERSQAVASSIGVSSEAVATLKTATARDKLYESYMDEASRPVLAQVLSAVLSSPLFLGMLFATAAPLLRQMVPPEAFGSGAGYQAATNFSYFVSVCGAVAITIVLSRHWLDYMNFRRFRMLTLRQLYDNDAEAFELREMNETMDKALLRFGPRRAPSEILSYSEVKASPSLALTDSLK